MRKKIAKPRLIIAVFAKIVVDLAIQLETAEL